MTAIKPVDIEQRGALSLPTQAVKLPFCPAERLLEARAS